MASIGGINFNSTPFYYQGAPGQIVSGPDGRRYWQNPNTGQYQDVTGLLTDGPVAPKVDLPTEAREMPVIGYRGWRWKEQFRLGYGTRGSLHSTGMNAVWVRGQLSAACLGGAPHEAPQPGCGCGIYVMADMDELQSHVSMDDATIVGAVVGWGRVVQHGREGWRAGHSRILALLDCKFSAAQLKATHTAAKEYGLPVLERDGLEHYVREWGDPFAESVKALPEANVG